jgi:histidinol-phosphate/aromatic aminotransferase/cobyric acid decarboxylase-like protein
MARSDKSRGQALVEFALVLPILSLLANDALNHAAREAARYAIVHGGSSLNPCPVGPAAADAVVPAASASCPYPSPSKESIHAIAREMADAAGVEVTVEVCYGAGCSGSTDAALATNERGTPVTVTVSTTVDTGMMALIGLTGFDVRSSSTMLVNH